MRNSFYFITLFIVLTSFSQERTLIGRLLDEESGDPVRYAIIANPQTNEEVSTNYSGYFQMAVQETDSLLLCSHIAYGDLAIPIPAVNQFLLKIPAAPREILITKIPQVNNGRKGDAHFPGGSLDLYSYILDSLFYSRQAARMGIEGLSKVRFTVNEDGSLSDIKVTKTIGAGVDQEVVRMLRNSSNWIAATQQGKPVKRQIELGVEFVFAFRDGDQLFPPKVADDYALVGESEKIYTEVDEPAQYPGGVDQFYEYLKQEMRYPRDAQREGIEGRVFLRFIVEKDSTISNIDIVRGIFPSLDQEAIRSIKNSGKWIPAMHNGHVVRQQMTQNILFKFADGNGSIKLEKSKRNFFTPDKANGSYSRMVSSYDHQFDMAGAAIKRGEYESAEEIYTKLILVRPSADLYFNRSIARQQQGNNCGYCEDIKQTYEYYQDVSAKALLIKDCIEEADTSFYDNDMLAVTSKIGARFMRVEYIYKYDSIVYGVITDLKRKYGEYLTPYNKLKLLPPLSEQKTSLFAYYKYLNEEKVFTSSQKMKKPNLQVGNDEWKQKKHRFKVALMEQYPTIPISKARHIEFMIVVNETGDIEDIYSSLDGILTSEESAEVDEYFRNLLIKHINLSSNSLFDKPIKFEYKIDIK